MGGRYKEKNFIVCLIILGIIIILSGFFAIHKHRKISDEIKSTLTNEASLIYNAANSLSKKETSVDDMVNFLREKFISGNYSSNDYSMNQYLDIADAYLNSMVSADKSIQGAWLSTNPDLFMKLENKIITLQNYSYTAWYYKDVNGEVIKGPRDNKRITPEDDPYYFEAVRLKGMILTDIYTDPHLKIDMVSIASPFYDNDGLLIGVAGIDITKDDLTEAFKDIKKASDSSQVYIFDSEGKYVVGTREPPQNLVSYLDRTKITAEIGSYFSKIFNGNWILVQDHNGKGPYLVAEVPLNKIHGNVSCILYTLYTLTILLFICLVVFFVLLNRRIPQIEDVIEETEQQIKR